MSTNKILSGSIIAAFGIAGLAMTADAQSRYGNVYDYESGHCGSACAAPAQSYSTHTQSSRYGSGVVQPSYVAPSMPISPGPVYVDCRATGTCAPQPQTVYSQPTTYSAPVQSYQTQSYQTQSAPPANCPAGTTAQSDGTCMQTSSSSSYSSYDSGTSYGSGSSYSSSSSSYGSGSSYSGGTPTNCPAGTTAQSDGTCMETSSSSSYSSYDSGSSYGSGSSYSDSSSTSSSYGSGSSYGGSMPTNCPAGTTAQSDGTCMEGGSSSSYSNAYTGSSVELFTGDATATPSYGYGSDGSFGATDYSPIRK